METTEIEVLRDEVRRLRDALHTDREGVSRVLAAILGQLRQHSWLFDGRGSYAWDDDRYRQEFLYLQEAIGKMAEEGLRRSNEQAHLICCRKGQLPLPLSVDEQLTEAYRNFHRLSCERSSQCPVCRLEQAKRVIEHG